MDASDPLVGKILQQRYRVVQRLSAGAMGVVYRGERVALQRPVAIKFLHADVALQDHLRKRFEVEARAMGRLSHPNCVSVIDFGVDDVPYVVMDYVDGRSLREVLSEGALPPKRALNIGRQLLTALVHAHAQGIIHRDIKPENMMLQDSAGLEDHLRVLDFGLAKLTNNSGGLTAGMVLGTPNYMAPEQAGEAEVDARADLYSSAILIFELLTGRQPFAAENVGEVLRRQLQMPAPSLRSAAPGSHFSAALEAVLQKALAKRADDRFDSAQDMLDALEAVPELKPSHGNPAVPAVAASVPPRGLPPPPSGKAPPAPAIATTDDATHMDPSLAARVRAEAQRAAEENETIMLTNRDNLARPTVAWRARMGELWVGIVSFSKRAWRGFRDGVTKSSRRSRLAVAAAGLILLLSFVFVARGGSRAVPPAASQTETLAPSPAEIDPGQSAPAARQALPAAKASAAVASPKTAAKPEASAAKPKRTTRQKSTRRRPSADSRWGSRWGK